MTTASGIAPLADGWLIVQDDATTAAWARAGSVTPVRLLPPVDGLDRFSASARTKHLKPDLEVACPVEVDGVPGVLALSSSAEAAARQGVVAAPPVVSGAGSVVRASPAVPVGAADEVAVRSAVPGEDADVLLPVLVAELSAGVCDVGAVELVEAGEGIGGLGGVVGAVLRGVDSVSEPSVVVCEVSSAPTSAETGCCPTISMPVTIAMARPNTATV